MAQSIQERVSALSPEKQRLLALKLGLVAQPDNSQNKTTLSAFVTANNSVDESKLRNHLGNHLPKYMIPTHITILDDLPRTPNGKVDRRALENWQITPTETPKPAPVTSAVDDDIEEQLTKIWQDLLNFDYIDVHDDFFEIGGYSLLAVRMFASVNKTFDTNLPISTLMEASTIAKLAQKIRSAGDNEIDAIVTIREDGDKNPLYVFQVNRFGIIHYQTFVQSLKKDRPVYGMVLAEEDEANMPSVVDLAQVYAQAIMKNQPEGPYYLLGLSVAGLAVYEVACILERETNSKAYAVLFDTYGPGYPRIQPTSKALPQKFSVFVKQFIQGTTEKKKFLLEDLVWQAQYRTSYWNNKLRGRFGLPVEVDELQEFRVRGDAILIQLLKYFEEIQKSDVEILLYRSQLQPIRAEYTETLHWDEVVPRENITIKPVSGAHTNLLRVGSVEVVSEHFQRWLADKA